MDDDSSGHEIKPSERRGKKRLKKRSNRNHSATRPRRSGRTKNRANDPTKTNSASSSSSSISSSESELGQIRSSKRSRGNEKSPVGKGKRNILDEIQPLAVDKSLTFQSVGGLAPQVDKLKEMVIFPLLYKDFYVNRGITPPRGVLFHGPPGTGKTLLARVLASEASSVGGREVTVFVRKGADVLNKWIGESERHLKLLFEQAVLKQPSIIFFDEIDGLAPMRSSKTDQIHNSVVATLLAEMDGLKDRGDVIVIGATNRIDTLDAALRRPGRFDLEFQFLLPSFQARREIFGINLASWKPPVTAERMDELALETVGYSGADIKFLCAEASVSGLRRRYPQIYRSSQKFVLDYDSIKIERCDWDEAKKVVGRSGERSVFSSSFTPLPLPSPLNLLLTTAVDEVRDKLKVVFPYNSKLLYQPAARVLLIDIGIDHDVLQYIISASLYDSIDGVPIHVLTPQTLATKNISFEDGSAVALFFSEVKRAKGPSVVYLPYLDHLMESLTPQAQLVLGQELNSMLFYPVLTIGYCENDSFGDNWKTRLDFEVIRVSPVQTKERCEFFRKVLTNAIRVKAQPVVVSEEELEVAPPEPIRLNPEQLKLNERVEERTMRELRAFLREVIFKLLRRKRFAPFSKAVDPAEVPDYLSVISKPMDLENMMIKVTNGEYHCARDFLADVNLIAANCLEYNPTVTDEDRELRSTAFELKDVAKSIIDREMDSDFEDDCIKIARKRQERNLTNEHNNEHDTDGTFNASFSVGSPNVEVPSSSTTIARRRGEHCNIQRRKRKSSCRRGQMKKKQASTGTGRKNSISSGSSGTNGGVSTTTPVKDEPRGTRSQGSCDTTLAMNYDASNQEMLGNNPLVALPEKKSKVADSDGFIAASRKSTEFKTYKAQLKEIYELAIRNTVHFTIRQLLDLRFKILSLIDSHGNWEDKPDLIAKLRELIEKPESCESDDHE